MVERSDFAARIWDDLGSPQTAPELAIYQHEHASIGRRFEPRTQVMSTDHFAAGLILKTITIRLTIEAGQHDADACYERALSALVAALLVVNSSISPAWTVQLVPGDEPLLYNLTPLQEHSVSVAAAWEMAAALRRQVEVATAEPTFVTLRGNHQASRDTP